MEGLRHFWPDLDSCAVIRSARPEPVAFHQLHEVCRTRIKQQLYCPHCERVVQRSEIVRGYEISKGQWVAVEAEEIAKIAPHSTDTMEIQEFVKISDIDPLYFNTSYYAVPEEPGRKAYQLLVETMQKSDTPRSRRSECTNGNTLS